MMSHTSSMVNSIPASCAMAGKCSAALVEPPVAPTVTAAFSSALRVTMSRGRNWLATSAITARPLSTAQRSRSSYGAGDPAEPGSARPIASLTMAMVLAVNWAAARARAGAGHAFQFVQILVGHIAGGVLAHRLEHIHPPSRVPAPLKWPGRMEPPYMNTAGTFSRSMAIIMPGSDLSQPARPTSAS